MTVLVTGGAGFIGANFIFYQLTHHPEDRVVCLDKLTYAGNMETLEKAMSNPKFKFIKADIADREAVYSLFETEKPDVIVNFAAESHVDRSISDPGIFLQTNIMGTGVLLDACRKYGIKRYHQVPPMRFTATFRWTDPICSLLRKPLFTPPVHTRLQRLRPIYWC